MVTPSAASATDPTAVRPWPPLSPVSRPHEKRVPRVRRKVVTSKAQKPRTV